ncbi:MAG: hypothetical protein JWM68_1604 [Verrucomicrobiales bacterium]|nr:hypothetical protein [Verrucomicrobiales bacterium]
MLRHVSLLLALMTCSAFAAERNFDFKQFPLNQTPTNFVSTVSGEGKPGDWKIIEDDVPAVLTPLSPSAPKTTKRNVLAQLATDASDEHFPLLMFNDETFADFTLTTRFKCVSGKVEQMAGIAFRIQDEKNYYVVRASASGNSFKFYKFVDGVRSAPLGSDIEIPAGVWHEMTVKCEGNQIRCTLNGKDAIPPLTDNSFKFGKLGYWTKSDSVSYFADTKINYTPRQPFAQKVIRDVMTLYPRLASLKIYAYKNKELRLIASSAEDDIGKPGTEVEENVIKNEKIYYGKANHICAVTLPLRDRNGDSVAALFIAMKAFPGQTQENAVARALPINKEISARIQGSEDFTQ